MPSEGKRARHSGPHPHRRRRPGQRRAHGAHRRAAAARSPESRLPRGPAGRRSRAERRPGGRRRRAPGIGDRRRGADPDLRSGRPDRGLGVHPDDVRHRGGDQPVARDAGGHLRPPRPVRPVRRDRPRPAPAGDARTGQVHRRGIRRDHGRDPPGRPDRRRREPVLLCLPAHRRRGGARRRSADHPRAHRRRQRRLCPGGRGRIAVGLARPGDRGHGGGQPHGDDPARLRGDGHRPGPAPDSATRPSGCRPSIR